MMKYNRILPILAACAAIFSSCADEMGRTEYSPYKARPSKEMMSVDVIAALDTEDRTTTAILAPEDFPNMQTLWSWSEDDFAYAVFEVDGTTDVCKSSCITVDPSDNSRATITFDDIPVDAKIISIETGTSGILGRRIPLGTKMDKSMVWLTDEVESEIGQAIVTGVVLKNECSYLRIDAAQVTLNGLKFDASELTLCGTGICSDEGEDEIVLDMVPVGTCLFPVRNTATGITATATISAGEKTIATIPSFSGMPLLCRIEDTGDDTETIEVDITVSLDPSSRKTAQVLSAELIKNAENLWKWEPTDKIVAQVIINGMSGTIASDEIAVDPSDSNKAVFHFKKMPKAASVTGIVFGETSAYGETCKVDSGLSRKMMYAQAKVTSPAGATSITGVELLHKCSYLNVFADKVEIEGTMYSIPSYSVSGIDLRDDGLPAAVNVINDQEAVDSVWVAVSASTLNLQVVANTEVSGAMIFSKSSLSGNCTLFKVRPGDVEKVSYRTVLYQDGTFIFNEMSTYAPVNAVLHGNPIAEYPAVSDSTSFVFPDAKSVAWASHLKDIVDVEFGSITQPYSLAWWFNGCVNLKSFSSTNLDLSNNVSCNSTFASCAALESIDVSNWNMSGVTDCTSMFDGCELITTLDVALWNLSQVKDLHFAFRNCKKLQILNVSAWDVSNVTTFKFTFQSCMELTALDVSNWNTSSVVDLQGIFRECTSIKELKVENWNVSNVTNMFQTFYGLKLTSLDISKWNMALVTNFENTFSGCNKLVTLDMSGCDLRGATSAGNMFRNCSSLETIYANDNCNLTGLSKDKSKGMFYKCVKLTGGLGTMIPENKVSDNNSDEVSAVVYARVDKAGQAGLFTEKK